MIKSLQRVFTVAIITAFLGSSVAVPNVRAGEMVMPLMPKPGTIVNLSSAYVPAHLNGITIDPANALQFNFLIDKGDGNLDAAQKNEEYTKLIKYFLASLAVPDKDQWVNLSPYEKNAIISDNFGRTEMGRDLLTQDYLLKQITSSLMYPESGLGKKFWDKVYERAYKEYGNAEIPVNTFNKVWIMPDEAVVYESGNTAYVVKSRLKVMLEEDYKTLNKNSSNDKFGTNEMVKQDVDKVSNVTSKIVKEIILPELEREINEGKNFAMLRQVYSGMVLATWYKKSLKESLLGKIYADKGKISGVDQDASANQAIYDKYLVAFNRGVYNYIKEDIDQNTKQPIRREYFSGGFTSMPDKDGFNPQTTFRSGTTDRPMPSVAELLRRVGSGSQDEVRAIFRENAGGGIMPLFTQPQRTPMVAVREQNVPESEAPTQLELRPEDGRPTQKLVVVARDTERPYAEAQQEFQMAGAPGSNQSIPVPVTVRYNIDRVTGNVTPMVMAVLPFQRPDPKDPTRTMDFSGSEKIINVPANSDRGTPEIIFVDGPEPMAFVNGREARITRDNDTGDYTLNVPSTRPVIGGVGIIEGTYHAPQALARIQQEPNTLEATNYRVSVEPRLINTFASALQSSGAEQITPSTKGSPAIFNIPASGMNAFSRAVNERLSQPREPITVAGVTSSTFRESAFLPTIVRSEFEPGQPRTATTMPRNVIVNVPGQGEASYEVIDRNSLQPAHIDISKIKYNVYGIENPSTLTPVTLNVRMDVGPSRGPDGTVSLGSPQIQFPQSYTLNTLNGQKVTIGPKDTVSYVQAAPGMPNVGLVRADGPKGEVKAFVSGTTIAPVLRTGNTVTFTVQAPKGNASEDNAMVIDAIDFAMDPQAANPQPTNYYFRLSPDVRLPSAQLAGVRDLGQGHFMTSASTMPKFVQAVDRAAGQITMPGGIDLNSAALNLTIKRDGKGVPLPLINQDLTELNQIQGLTPQIMSIKPLQSLPLLSELEQKMQPAAQLLAKAK